MAVKIRLSRLGRKKAPFYRIVVTDERTKRDGRHLEFVGTYSTATNPPSITLKEDRVKYWLGVGAQTTGTVTNILEKKMPGYLKGLVEKRRAKLQTARKKRKDRVAKAGTKATAPKKAPKKAAKKAAATK